MKRLRKRQSMEARQLLSDYLHFSQGDVGHDTGDIQARYEKLTGESIGIAVDRYKQRVDLQVELGKVERGKALVEHKRPPKDMLEASTRLRDALLGGGKEHG